MKEVLNLKNGVIFRAKHALDRLSNEKLPVITSLKLAELGEELAPKYRAISTARNGLVKKYGKKDKRTHQLMVRLDSPEYPDYEKEEELLMEQETEVKFKDKIKLPLMVSATCDKCNHNMDKEFLIETAVLQPLLPFVTVETK